MGKQAAHELVELRAIAFAKKNRHLRDLLGEDEEVLKHVSVESVDGMFDAKRYLGLAEEFVDRVVAASEKSEPRIDS